MLRLARPRTGRRHQYRLEAARPARDPSLASTLAGDLDWQPLRVGRENASDQRLAFTMFFENLTPLVDLAQILAGLGLVTILLAVLKHAAERRRWQQFKLRVDDWTDDLRRTEERHPRELDDEEWKIECERLLTDSRFSPMEIDQILDTSVVVAKGIASVKFFT